MSDLELEPKQHKNTVLKVRCPLGCGIVMEEKTELIFSTRMTKMSCGHTVASDQVISSMQPEDLESMALGGQPAQKLRPFQCENIRFGERANFRFGCADEQGLGKTVTAAGIIRMYGEQLGRILIICTASTKHNWFKETFKWAGAEYLPQVIETSKQPPYMDHFKVFIASVGMLRRCKWVDDPNVVFDTIILDECQSVKNPASSQTQCVRTLVGKAKHFIWLSATPIKNHAGEFAVILNMTRPDRFPYITGRMGFVERFCDVDDRGRPAGIRWEMRNRFDELTNDIIIRHLRTEVAAEIPQVTRSYRFAELSGEVQRAWERSLDALMDDLEDDRQSESDRAMAINAHIMTMRRLVGVAKVGPTVEYVNEEFLEENRDGQKLVIFYHHEDVKDLLIHHLASHNPVVFHSGLSGDERDKVVEEFKNNPDRRIGIFSTLAGGVGINLQFAHTFAMMERQWNPANEEQAEGRFLRIGQLSDFVNGIYFVALATVDEDLAEIVERKRAVFNQTMDKQDMQWHEAEIMQELVGKLRERGLERYQRKGKKK